MIFTNVKKRMIGRRGKMKHRRHFILLIITIVALASACTPIAEATEKTVETPMGVTPTVTATQTQEPTETKQPTPEPTATPTTKPVTPLPELIQNLSAESTAEILEIMAEQFPVSQEGDLYRFFCVGGEMITHEPAIQLPTGQEISHSIYCQYYDAEGNQQGVHIPLLSYSHQDLDYKIVGYWTNSKDDRTEEDWQRVVDRNKTAYSMEEVASGNSGGYKIKDLGWSGPGHLIYLGFAMPAGEEPTEEEFYTQSETGYFNEAIYALMNEAQFKEFAQTGDPSVLPQTTEGEPLLLPLNVSFESIYGAEQYETRDYDFD
jgi:hypothetical protein